MRLVRRFVRRKPQVAVDAVHAVLRFLHPDAGVYLVDFRYQSLHKLQKIGAGGLVTILVGHEPLTVVVLAQVVEVFVNKRLYVVFHFFLIYNLQLTMNN